jgi:hypothetical protein
VLTSKSLNTSINDSIGYDEKLKFFHKPFTLKEIETKVRERALARLKNNVEDIQYKQN